MKLVEIKYSKTKSPKKKALYLMTLEQVIMEKLTDDDMLFVQVLRGRTEVRCDNELFVTRLRALWSRIEDLDD